MSNNWRKVQLNVDSEVINLSELVKGDLFVFKGQENDLYIPIDVYLGDMTVIRYGTNHLYRVNTDYQVFRLSFLQYGQKGYNA